MPHGVREVYFGSVLSRNDLSIFLSLGTEKKVKPVLFSSPALKEKFRECTEVSSGLGPILPVLNLWMG